MKKTIKAAIPVIICIILGIIYLISGRKTLSEKTLMTETETIAGESQTEAVNEETKAQAHAAAESSTEKADEETQLQVNINTADKTELMKLPGIGEAKAQKIIDYREANGDFTAIEDIMKVSGIKEGIFSKIKAYIVV